MPVRRLSVFVPLLTLAACSGSAEPPSSNTAATSEWTVLAKGDWSLDPGTEEVDHCIKVTIKEDTYLSAIRPIAPLGTHHTFVALSDTADGNRCVSAVATGTLVYAAGLGSKGITMPKGVAMKIAAGKVLNLSLHIYNPTSEVLKGTSGLEVVKMDPKDVKYLAATTLAGPLAFTLPPGVVTVTNDCQVDQEQTAFVLFPHMHKLGTHLKTIVTVGGVETVLHDADFSFQDQPQIPIDPLTFEAGDRIRTECTYDNNTANNVTFGESSDTEMCFSVFFRYPDTAYSFCKSLSTTVQ